MFGPRIQQYARHIAEMVVSPLVAIGLTPNMATLLGLILNCATAAVIATGSLRIGGAMLLFAGLFDMVDGALARKRNMKTTFGAFFDSTLDRFSEGIVLLGIIVYAMQQPVMPARTWLVALTYVAGLSSLMVSYARARAEGLGLECKTGLMARPERVLLLAVGLIIGGAAWLLWVIGILAVTSTYTSVQRIVVVWRTIRRAQVAPAAPPAMRSERNKTQESTASDAAAQDGHTPRRDTPSPLGRRKPGSAPR